MLRQISFYRESKWILSWGKAHEINARKQPSRLLRTFFECNEAAGQNQQEIGKNLFVGAPVVALGVSAFLIVISHALHLVCGIGTCCRFTPSCSVYATTAVKGYGICKGLRLSVLRLFRCHPFGGWGGDPVECAKKESYSCRALNKRSEMDNNHGS